MTTLDPAGSGRWFYDFAGNRIGPFEAHEIRAAINAGHIKPDTPILQAGNTAWRRAADSMFGPFFQEGPPPDDLALATTVKVGPQSPRPGVDVPAKAWLPPSALLPLRVIAGVVDGLVLGTLCTFAIGGLCLIYAVMLSFGLWRELHAEAPNGFGDALSRGLGLFLSRAPTELFLTLLFLLGLYAAYFALSPILTGGATIGKRLTGLRVVHVNGLPLTAGRRLLRSLVFIFSGGIPCVVGVIFGRESRGLHDLAACTRVVAESDAPRRQ